MEMSSPALVGVAHGTSSPLGANAVKALIESVIKIRPELFVVLSFVDVQQPTAREALESLPPRLSAVVVPLLLSSGYHVHVDLAQAISAQTDRKVVLAKTLGPDPRLIELLIQRLANVGFNANDHVILAVAGSSDERARSDCEIVRSALSDASGQEVSIGYLSAAQPSLADAIKTERTQHPTARMIVCSYLLAPGYFQSLIEDAGADLFTPPLLVPDEPVPQKLIEIVIDRYQAMLELL